jgi:hypothetical protein
MEELVFKITYKDVFIKGLATQDKNGNNGNIEIKYYHPQTGQLQEWLINILTGWSFQDKELNEQIEKLIRLYQKYNNEIKEV